MKQLECGGNPEDEFCFCDNCSINRINESFGYGHNIIVGDESISVRDLYELFKTWKEDEDEIQ